MPLPFWGRLAGWGIGPIRKVELECVVLRGFKWGSRSYWGQSMNALQGMVQRSLEV